MKVLRTDIGALRPAKKTSQGFLRAEGYASRTGVFEYVDPSFPGGIRRELRPPEEVFRADVLAGFEGAPLTDGHPSEGEVTADNARDISVGAVLSPGQREDNLVRVSLTVSDAKTIAKVKHGKSALSVGYNVDFDKTPGIDPVHGRYDGIQRNLVINHLALVDVGRAGPEARLRLDSADVVALNDSPSKGVSMAKQEEIEGLKAAAEQVAAQTSRADKAEKECAEATARADKAEGQVASLKEELVKLEKVRQDAGQAEGIVTALKTKLEESEKARKDAEDPAKLRARVQARVKLETSAITVLGGHLRLDEMNDREVMVAVLEKLGRADGLNEQSDQYVEGRFGGAIDSYLSGEKAFSALRLAPAKETEARADAKSAREKMILRNRNLDVQEGK